MTAKKACKRGEYGSFEHLLFVYLYRDSFFRALKVFLLVLILFIVDSSIFNKICFQSDFTRLSGLFEKGWGFLIK